MGMFDSLVVRCPSCSGTVEFQSKSGDCNMVVYDLGNVPTEVLGGLVGMVMPCECGKKMGLRITSQVSAFSVADELGDEV